MEISSSSRALQSCDTSVRNLFPQLLSEGLKLCFEEKPGFREYAGMTFHFQGADFVVQALCMYLHNTEKRYFCVAMLPSTEGTVIGAWQQQGTCFVYDLKSRQLQFASEDCSKDWFLSVYLCDALRSQYICNYLPKLCMYASKI